MGICRVIIESEPQSGPRNMAVDEALLDVALEQGACSVRWYRWQSATVSLGYFQDAGQAAAVPELAGLPAVRRLTGGGAILHHHEWTYSLAVPPGHPLAAMPGGIYDRVHRCLIAHLALRGVPAALRGHARPEAEHLFLCFGRGDPRDIVIGENKILGSAQRRRRGAVLQHGSLLLRRSIHAPAFAGILDLVPGFEVTGSFVRGTAASLGGLFGDVELASHHVRAVSDRAFQLEPAYATLDPRRRPTAI